MKPLTLAAFLAAFTPSTDPRRPTVLLSSVKPRRVVAVWRGKGRVTKIAKTNGA